MKTNTQTVAHTIQQPSPSGAPLMRWWWFSSHLNAEAIDADLEAMHAANIGGVEATFVYPVAPESTAFLSEEFLRLIRHAATKTEELGMRFDLTLGSGWPFGGPYVSDRYAARRLHWECVELPPQEERVRYESTFTGDRLIAAYLGAGSIQEMPTEWRYLSAARTIPLPPIGHGPRVLLLAVSRLTGQNVKRASAGAEGLVLDHYSAQAVQMHLDAVSEPLLKAAGAERVHAGFCDSFEVFHADWTPQLPREFASRRGYELLPILWKLRVDDPDASTLRADLMATLGELFDENFLSVIHRWTESHGILFRAQCYGEPPMLISSARHVDLVEGEGWGWKRWTKNSWAVSAADALERPLVSSETWTWVHSPSFRASPFDLLGEAYEHLLGGANFIVGHGWPLGASLGPHQPVFYASGAIDSRNPWWAVAPELFSAIGRASSVLQLGSRAVQVAVYHPVFEVRANGTGEHRLDIWRQTQMYIDDEFVEAIRTMGLDYDVVDDVSMERFGIDRFQVLLVPCGCMPTPAAKDIMKRSRCRIVFLERPSGPERCREIHGALSEVEPPIRMNCSNTVGITTRSVGDDSVSLIVNTGNSKADVQVFSSGNRNISVWDVSSGKLKSSSKISSTFPLDSYEGVLVTQSSSIPEGENWHSSNLGTKGAGLLTDWQVIGHDGTPRPVHLPHVWEDDQMISEQDESAVYEANLDLESAACVTLDFGSLIQPESSDGNKSALRGSSFSIEGDSPVSACAKISVDSILVCSIWHTPFTASLGNLKKGIHRIRIEVSGLGVRNTLTLADSGMNADVERSSGRRFRVQDYSNRTNGLRSGLLVDPIVYLD